ncbi:MAG: hypothetical protein ABIP48_23275 [Planctomycetota bacterium]
MRGLQQGAAPDRALNPDGEERQDGQVEEHEEDDAIHKAAGPAKASKFVRALAVAAARNDAAAVKAIMEGVKTGK